MIFKPASGGSEPALTALNIKTGAVRTLFEYQDGDSGYQFIPRRNEVVYYRRGATASEWLLPARSLGDGRFLLYDEYPGSNTGSLRMMDARSGESWPIAETTHDETQRWYDVQWAPDGTFIVVSRHSARTEYRAFEGVTYDAVVTLMNAKK